MKEDREDDGIYFRNQILELKLFFTFITDNVSNKESQTTPKTKQYPQTAGPVCSHSAQEEVLQERLSYPVERAV